MTSQNRCVYALVCVCVRACVRAVYACFGICVAWAFLVSNFFIMLYLNQQITQFIIALNSFPTAVLLIPNPQTSKVPFKLFQSKMNTSEADLTYVYIHIY